MSKRIFVSLAVSVIVGGFVAAAPAGANGATKVDLLHDCGPNSVEGPCAGGNRNMAGPEVGFVNYNQNGQGDLIIVSATKKSEPNRTFSFTLYCGPTHDTAGNIAHHEADAMTTNVVGNGNTGAIKIPMEQLLARCGPGAHTGHVDLDSGFDTTLAATPINFEVP